MLGVVAFFPGLWGTLNCRNLLFPRTFFFKEKDRGKIDIMFMSGVAKNPVTGGVVYSFLGREPYEASCSLSEYFGWAQC